METLQYPHVAGDYSLAGLPLTGLNKSGYIQLAKEDMEALEELRRMPLRKLWVLLAAAAA